MDDKIWINDIEILFREDKLKDYIPFDTMSDYEKVNAITRFSIYFAIILYILKDDMSYFYIPLLTCVVIYFLYKVNTTNERFEEIDDSYLDKWYVETKLIKTKKIILLDDNNDEFELFIKDGKLEIKSLKK